MRILLLLLTLLFAAPAQAQPRVGLPTTPVTAPAGLVPPGLSPGDTFFVVFVTSGVTSANITSAQLEAFADAQAATGPDTGMITGWTALQGHMDGTLTTTSAFGGDVTSPIYLSDGTLVANNRAAMFATPIPQAINVDQNCAPGPAGGVWTGFANNGNLVMGTLGTLGGAGATLCNIGSTTNTSGWAFTAGAGPASQSRCDSTLPMYVLSPPLVVAGAAAPNPVGIPASPVDW